MDNKVLSLDTIAMQISNDTRMLGLLVDCSKIEAVEVVGEMAWKVSATYNDRDVIMYVYPRKTGFVFQYVSGGQATNEAPYSSDNLRDKLLHFLGGKIDTSMTQSVAWTMHDTIRRFAKKRSESDKAEILKHFTSAISSDLGHGPTVVQSWVMDAPKDDYVDIFFVVKGLRNQKLDFDIQLHLAFSPHTASSSGSMYAQYIDNRSDRIYIDTDEISAKGHDHFRNLRERLEDIVAAGNKKYDKEYKKLSEA